MESRFTTRQVGERAILVELSGLDEVHRLWRGLRSEPLSGVEDAIAGATTVLIVMQPGVAPEVDNNQLRRRMSSSTTDGGRGREVVVAVSYDGPDLAEVATLTGLDPDEVVRRHSSCRYTVAFLGFAPGFAYLVGGDQALRVSRLDRPRTSVPAGSVALAADMTAVYPQSTPGGWRLIGMTNENMFDPSRDPPSLLEPGDGVRFTPSTRTKRTAAPFRDDMHVRSNAYIRVLDPGLLTTVQDQGRPGWGHLGVPRAGAADARSAAMANRLVGNPPEAALLESTLIGPRLVLGAARRIAITGARADVTVEGLPARQDTALVLDVGHEVAVGRFHSGLRVYVAVEGGIDVDPVLGSRSTDTFSSLGPPPLAAGATVALAPKTTRTAATRTAATRTAATVTMPGPGDLIVLDALRGPRDDWVGPVGMAILKTAEFVVSATTDRTGVRLDGPTVPTAGEGELPSEGIVAGAIQIPPGGQPIVLMRNHQSTGGYPVAAVLTETEHGVDLLAQARPGVRVRFRIT